ncbi:hypothetical protein ACFZBP_38045 [Streptomyces sp. NPDC008086]|uniref:hypothetical protein n=1 Tax=Streptomyces sp. NPDC008086 TaxID=3364807 RepID=UPI0036E13EE3
MADPTGPVRGPFPMTRPRAIAGEAHPGAGECVVVLLGTALHCLSTGELPTSGQRWFRPTSRYWVVDVAVKSMSLAVELDSADKGLRFHGTVDVDWRIADPKLAVQRGDFNVERLLRRLIMPRLTAAAKKCSYDAVQDLEESLDREQFTGESGDGLLKVVDVSFDLRPDPGAFEVERAGSLDQMRRSQAMEVIEQGEAGITALAISLGPDRAMEVYRNMRDDRRFTFLAQLELTKAVQALADSEEPERTRAIQELLARLGESLPGELPLPRPADGLLQLDGARPGSRDGTGTDPDEDNTETRTRHVDE